MSNRLEIGKAVSGLEVPQIGVEDAKVRETLVQYGEQFRSYLDLNQLGRQLRPGVSRNIANSVANTTQDKFSYWRRIFEVAGLERVVTQLEVLVASDFIEHDLTLTSK